jgi:hypothetical protein
MSIVREEGRLSVGVALSNEARVDSTVYDHVQPQTSGSRVSEMVGRYL